MPNRLPAVDAALEHDCSLSRRSLLRRLGAAGGVGLLGLTAGGVALPGTAFADALDKQARDALTPDQILARLLSGNERFRSQRPHRHDYLAQKAATQEAQHPAAIILSCIDSRAPAEILMDTGIGEVFNARVAGNLVNDDILGSMEYGCAVAGAKLVLVMGHTSCGAIKGAISGAKLDHLTALVDRLKPAAEATHYNDGSRDESNPTFVDEVARTHVRMTVGQIRQKSATLARLERNGDIALRGAMYHLKGGHIEILDA